MTFDESRWRIAQGESALAWIERMGQQEAQDQRLRAYLRTWERRNRIRLAVAFDDLRERMKRGLAP